jgi:hypothetical protein
MKYTALGAYNFTAAYYKAENTSLTGNLPNWVYTYIKDIKVQLAPDISTGRITMYTQEELALNYVVKNFRDASGTSFLDAPPNALGIDTSSFLIYACVPQFNLFGYLDGFKCTLQQLSGARSA